MLLAFLETPQRHERLSVFPVVASDEPDLAYLLLAEALQRGIVTVSQDSGGSAPFLVAQNRGTQPVLILDCETMVGPGENRSTSQSVLLGPATVTRFPISCLDTGKWSCRELEREYSSPLQGFPMVEGQVGILAFLGRELLGLDVLGTPGLYSPLHRRLLTGYLITALAAGKDADPEGSASEEELENLALALQGAERVATFCPGSGEYCNLTGAVSGGELRHNGHLVHLSVFPKGVAA